MIAPIPEPMFSTWFPWAMVRSGGPKALDEAGTYLLARFADQPPPVVDLVDEHIFYVGETHGRTRTLRTRLTDFGRSAGFGVKQQAGHYAAWGYPEAFEVDRRGDQADPSRVYVAVCPFPGGNLPRATRGVFPGLIEAMVLWHYTNKHARLPVLNNSGGDQDRVVPDPPVLDAAVLSALVSGGNQATAARMLLNDLATALGYSPNRRISAWAEDGWTGVARRLYGGWSLSIGWRIDSAEIGIWLSDGSETWFGSGKDEAPVATEPLLRALIGRFWSRWYSEY